MPLPPSQPQIVDADRDWVTLIWAPPPRDNSAPTPADIFGYVVECKEIGLPEWFSASERLISSTQLTGNKMLLLLSGELVWHTSHLGVAQIRISGTPKQQGVTEIEDLLCIDEKS